MNNDKPKVGELILKYRIERHSEDKLAFRAPRGMSDEEAVAVVSAHKPEILAELIRREEESAAKEAARVEEARAIRAGEIAIRPEWHDGEILSDWQVFGEAAKALEEIGAAKYISGWGYCVEGAIIKALGKEFTFPQVEEFLRPSREAKEAREQAEAEERQAKFDEAQRTGEPVELDSWMANCNDPREECSLDHVIEYAMPDGTTRVERHHTW